MADPLAPMREPFSARVRCFRVWSYVALHAPRVPLALLLAVMPAALLLLFVVLAPPDVGGSVTRSDNVHDAFARFISATATASAIAVSVATLTFRREVRGIAHQVERHKANEAFRERVRAGTGRDALPVAMGPFLHVTFEATRDAVRVARRAATSQELTHPAGRVALGRYLDTLEEAATRAMGRMQDAGENPDRLLPAALDFELELTGRLAHRFKREASFSPDLRAALADLYERLEDVVILIKYAKALDLQWGLSRMSLTILVTAIPSILAATFMVLAYGEGAVSAFGTLGATALVGAALAVVLLPLTAFVSHLLRFVFLNQHTLPTDGFILGPEEWEIVEEERRGGAVGEGRPRRG